MTSGALVAAAVLLVGEHAASAGVVVTTAHAQSGASTLVEAAVTNGGNTMIDLIQDLIRILSKDRLTVDDISMRIGPVAHDAGGLLPLELKPLMSGVRSAQLARDPVSALPYLLELQVASDARPTVRVLKTALGDYRQVLTNRGRPREILFYPSALGTQWSVVVIAELATGGDGLDDATVTRISLRRDPVSP